MANLKGEFTMKNLKKKLAAILAAAMLVALIAVPAFAETIQGEGGGYITYTPPSSPFDNSEYSEDTYTDSGIHGYDYYTEDMKESISVTVSPQTGQWKGKTTEDYPLYDGDSLVTYNGITYKKSIHVFSHDSSTQVNYHHHDGTNSYHICYIYDAGCNAHESMVTDLLNSITIVSPELEKPEPTPEPTPEPVVTPTPSSPSSSTTTTTTTTTATTKSSSRLEIVEYTGPRAIKIFVNETQVYPDSNPIIVNDRTLVPIRAIAEAMGYDVGWNQALQRVTISAYDGSGEIQIGIGEYSIALPYKSVPIDVAAMIYEDRTYIPVRAVAEALDARVEWDGDVHIYQW